MKTASLLPRDPTVSVIIPALNEEARIAKCIASVQRALLNTPVESEIIVVDNGSTDTTNHIASSFLNVRVISEPQRSLTRARQRGFLASRGSFIVNIDADVLIPEQWFSRALQAFARNSELVAVSGPQIFYDLPWYLRELFRIVAVFEFGYYFLNRHIIGSSSLLLGCNNMIRRQALIKVGGHNTSLDFHGEDADLMRRLNQVGAISFSFSLLVHGSGRRIRRDGAAITIWRDSTVYLSGMFNKSPLNKAYVEVRDT